jgi:hypothetical protein
MKRVSAAVCLGATARAGATTRLASPGAPGCTVRGAGAAGLGAG